jgi:hypothetical protein
VSNLVVGVFGDVRPANPDDTASYPDSILASIFSGLQTLNVPVTVDVGDHCFQDAKTSGGTCHTQMVSHFMAQRANYSGKLLPTMGNHEGCAVEAATATNCPSPFTGAGYILQDYLNDVVQPSTGQSSPYYSVVLYGAWGTAKFIHVAANDWDTTSANTQGKWLTSSLAVPTTYTFVVRHEPSSAATAAGVTPSETIYQTAYNAGNLTLSLTGHTHGVWLPGSSVTVKGTTYGVNAEYEVIIGNGGAPLDAGNYYGFAVLERRASDGAIVVQEYETMSSDGTTLLNNAKDPSFVFARNANGSVNSNANP